MSSKFPLTLAIGTYDRHVPFLDGTLAPPSELALDVKVVGPGPGALRDGANRHDRVLRGEFDVAEFSLSSYLIAASRKLPIVGIPVFPVRKFSQSLIWVRADSPLSHPRELAEKRVAISSFQNSFSLLSKGDLKFHYGVPWEDVNWIATSEEALPVTLKPGTRIERLSGVKDLGQLLADKTVDALFAPRVPASVTSGKVPARQLFKDAQAEERAYYRAHGYLPALHVVVAQKALLEKEPWLAGVLVRLFNEAKEIATRYYADATWSSLPFGAYAFQEARSFFGEDPWRYGFKANKAYLERFIGYSHDQGLIEAAYPAEELFSPGGLDT